MRKIFALLLCLTLMLTALISCDDSNETGSPVDSNDSSTSESESVTLPPPKTPDEYMARALAYMETHAAKCTTTKVTENGILGTEDTTVEVSYEKGNSVTTFLDAEGQVPEITYYDGVFYVLSTQKKLSMDMDSFREALQTTGFDATVFSAFGYENVTVEKDANGNTVITGEGDGGRMDEMRKIFGSLVDLVTISSARISMVFDSEYRLIRYETWASADTVSYSNHTVSVYEYGSAYEPILPENAASFIEVSSLEELYISEDES